MSNTVNPRVLAEIKKRHGSIIDLNKTPNVIIDIIRDFHPALPRLDDDGGGGAPGSPPGSGGGHGAPGSPPAPPGDGGGGAPGSPPAPPPPRGPDDRELGMATVMNLLLEVKRDLGALHAKVDTTIAKRN